MNKVIPVVRTEKTIISFKHNLVHAGTSGNVIEVYPDTIFKGTRLCVVTNPERFEICDFLVGNISHFQKPISAKMFPVIPNFKDCKVPQDFEKRLEELIKVDYVTCSPNQRMKLIFNNSSQYDCPFEADMHGIR